MSTKPFQVGEILAAPGESARGFLVQDTGRGATIRVPVVVINGAADGPVFAVTAGVHGAEYPGIEAAIRLTRTISPADVKGTVIIVPIVTLPSFQRRAVYVNPLDGVNPNRTFPGNPSGTITEMLTAMVFRNVIAPADYYIDMHGGDMIEALVPFTLYYRSGNEALDSQARELATAYGIPIVVGSTTIRGSSYGAAALAGKPAILPESGGQGILDEASTRTHVRGVLNALKRFGVLSGTPEVRPSPTFLNRFVWLAAEQDCIFYPKVVVGQHAKEGELLAEFTDIFGEKIGELRSPAAGPVLFLVTSPAINRGDPLMALGA